MMGSDQRARVRITILLSGKLPSEVQDNVCICTVLHECISTICTSWAAPSGSEVKQSFSTIQALKEEEKEKEKNKKNKNKKTRKKPPPSLQHNPTQPVSDGYLSDHTSKDKHVVVVVQSLL